MGTYSIEFRYVKVLIRETEGKKFNCDAKILGVFSSLQCCSCHIGFERSFERAKRIILICEQKYAFIDCLCRAFTKKCLSDPDSIVERIFSTTGHDTMVASNVFGKRMMEIIKLFDKFSGWSVEIVVGSFFSNMKYVNTI